MTCHTALQPIHTPTFDGTTILIVQRDPSLGLKISSGLCPDGHRVLSPVTTLHGAYKAILSDMPDIAVLDGDMDTAETERLSDMLLMLGIPHLIAFASTGRVVRCLRDGETNQARALMPTGGLVDTVVAAVWDLHARAFVFDLLATPEVELHV